jgi:hypothetical protein
MRLYTRIVFCLNCLYQALAGVLFLFAPLLSIGLYGFPAADGQSMAAHVGVRIGGVLLLVAAVISALIALNPDRYPVLLPIMALVSALTLICWGLTLFAHETTASQVGVDAIVQVLLLIGALGYAAKAGKASATGAALHA